MMWIFRGGRNRFFKNEYSGPGLEDGEVEKSGYHEIEISGYQKNKRKRDREIER
jgi:hypothetical protein